MSEEWTHKFTDTKPYDKSSYGGSRIMHVEAGLHKMGGNQYAYFSVTGEITRPKARDCDACGCLHEDIMRLWPILNPVISLHLSDENGTPMHAEANSWYQMAGALEGAGETYHAGNSKQHTPRGYEFPNADECLQSFADYVRIPLAEAQRLRDIYQGEPDTRRSLHTAWIKGQAERWKAEAQTVINLLDSLNK